jgi:hypothetical protein
MGHVIRVDFTPSVKTRKTTSIERREKKAKVLEDRFSVVSETEVITYGQDFSWAGLAVWIVVLGGLFVAWLKF